MMNVTMAKTLSDASQISGYCKKTWGRRHSEGDGTKLPVCPDMYGVHAY